MNNKVILMILDGWGISPDPKVSAIAQAKTPFVDSLYQQFPHTTLLTDGMHVGLPEGQMGNSEVGHMNLGAGRIVYQELARINKAIRDGSLARNKKLLAAIDYAKANDAIILFDAAYEAHRHLTHEGRRQTVRQQLAQTVPLLAQMLQFREITQDVHQFGQRVAMALGMHVQPHDAQSRIHIQRINVLGEDLG